MSTYTFKQESPDAHQQLMDELERAPYANSIHIVLDDLPITYAIALGVCLHARTLDTLRICVKKCDPLAGEKVFQAIAGLTHVNILYLKLPNFMLCDKRGRLISEWPNDLEQYFKANDFAQTNYRFIPPILEQASATQKLLTGYTSLSIFKLDQLKNQWLWTGPSPGTKPKPS